jgi:tetratricopeptide (TPR) repeat protein
MKTYKLKFVLLALLTCPFSSYAREGVPTDFPFYVEKSEVQINIEKDGSYQDVTTNSFSITKEEGKNFFSPFKLSFDPTSEEMTVLDAYVINNGQKIQVDKNNIHTSNSAARKDGLVDSSELAIPFSQVKPGSTVFMKILTKNKPGPFGDYFHFKNRYGQSTYVLQDIVKIKSPKELFYTVVDPKKILNVKMSKDSEGNFILDAFQKTDFVHVAVGEIGSVSHADGTALMVSNVDNWGTFRQMVQDKFVSVQLKDTVPPALMDVIKKIPKNASFETKVNSALIYITSNYDYLGDWRGDGKVIPKSVNKIVADRFGDCKDFSTLLINLLRGMNIKADYALVNRSYDQFEISDKSVPMMDNFNHMIVRAENNGKVFWLDPTNKFSVGVNIRGDIAGKNALVLSETKNVLEKIPELDSLSQSNTIVKLYQFDSEDSATVDVISKNQGESVRMIQDALKGKTETETQDAFMKVITKGERSAVLQFNVIDKKEKEYSDLNIKAKYRANQLMTKEKDSKNGKLPLPNVEFLKTFMYLHQDDIGELNLNLLPKVENLYFYKNIFLTGKYPRTCHINANWIEASRVIELKDVGIVIKDKIDIKIKKLTKNEFGNRSFSVVASQIYNCFNEGEIEYTYNTKKHDDKLSAFEAKIAKLKKEEKIEKRIEKSYEITDTQGTAKSEEDFFMDSARLLLEKNMVEKPNDSETLRAMAAYYSARGFIIGNTYVDSDFKLALTYLTDAVKADPKNLKAVLDLVKHLNQREAYNDAREILLQNTEKVDDAKLDYLTARKLFSAFFRIKEDVRAKKYFDLAMSKATKDEDKAYLYASRAGLNTTIDDNQGCVNDFEKSLSLNGKVAWNYGNVADCYNKLQMFDKAIERARKAISLMDYGAAHSVLADSYIGKGELSFNKGDYVKAEENYKLALMEFPRADVYLHLAKVYFQVGKKDQAEEAARTALQKTDEDHPREWVQKTLMKLVEYYKNRDSINRKIAQEKTKSTPVVKSRKLDEGK